MEGVFAGKCPSLAGLYLFQADSAVDVFIFGIVCAALPTITRTSIVGSAVRLVWLRLIVKIVDETDGCKCYDAHRCSESQYLREHHFLSDV
uniref:Uncharacterized protein n=1 Tax=Anopheles funestus TaxID=62324 RepID=A0A182RZE8_ANOFN